VTNNSNEQGFVLPYVLVVIAVLAFVSAIAAERLRRSTAVLVSLQDQSRIERMMVTAEAEAVYALLTGITIDGGIDLNPNSPVETDFGFVDSDGGLRGASSTRREEIIRDVWSAKGGVRSSKQSDGEVYIQLRDVFGFVSLTSMNEENVIQVLKALGGPASQAQSLTAKLADYVDTDSKRQFKGAERADYRLRDKPPPSNSPLRNYDELSHVLGWDEALNDIDVLQFKNMTTLQFVSGVKNEYANAAVQKALRGVAKESETVEGGFDVEALELQNPTMSDNSRLTFWVQTQDGLYKKRVIEIRRDSNNTTQPFRRFWVYETTVSQDDLEFDRRSTNEIKNVIQAATVHLP